MQKNTPTSHPKDLAIPFTISMQIGCNTCSLLMFSCFSFRRVLIFFLEGGMLYFPNNFPCLAPFPPPLIHGGTRRKLQRSPKSQKRSTSEICIGKGCRVPVPPDNTEKNAGGFPLMGVDGWKTPLKFLFKEKYFWSLWYKNIYVKTWKTIWKSYVGKGFPFQDY